MLSGLELGALTLGGDQKGILPLFSLFSAPGHPSLHPGDLETPQPLCQPLSLLDSSVSEKNHSKCPEGIDYRGPIRETEEEIQVGHGRDKNVFKTFRKYSHEDLVLGGWFWKVRGSSFFSL